MRACKLLRGSRVVVVVCAVLALQCRPLLPRRATLEKEPDVGGIPFRNVNALPHLRYATLSGDCAQPDSKTCVGVPLVTGDVIYLRRWFPGTNDRGANDLQWTGPQSYEMRIPLRHVDDGPNGMLYPEERELLALVLTTQRSAAFNRERSDDTFPALLRYLQKNERIIWNSFISSLRVKRVEQQVVNPTTQETEHIERNLLLTVAMNPMCKNLRDGKEEFATLFRCPPSDADYVEVEIVGIDRPYDSPWAATIGYAGGSTIAANNAYYTFNRTDREAKQTGARQPLGSDCAPAKEADNVPNSKDPAVNWLIQREAETRQQLKQLDFAVAESQPALGKPWSTFDFVDVDLSGVDMRQPGDAERRWTLKDWDEAQVCRAPDGTPARIEEITFHGSVLQFRVVDNPTTTSTFEAGTTTTESRFWRRIKKTPGACTACTNINLLARGDLRELYPHDAKRILWSYMSGGRKHVIGIPSCSPPR